MYRACGKEVLHDNQHYADACSVEAAEAIASALNWREEPLERDDATFEIPFPTRHSIRQESDEYACSCGIRWDVSEGSEHP